MQPRSACVILAALAVAASGVSDETSLLQMTNDPAPEQSLDMPKLHCDLTGGCKYEGLPPRPEKPTPTFPSFLPGMDPEQLKKLVESIKLPDAAQIQKALSEVKLPDMAKVAKDLAKFMPNGAPPAFQMPDLSNVFQDMSKFMPGAAAPQAPQAPQVPDFSKMFKDMSKLIPGAAAPKAPQAPQLPDLAKIAKGLSQLKLPGLSALQVSSGADANTSSAYFVPDNLMVCIQGSEEYLSQRLARLKESPLGAGYQNSKVTAGSCADLHYADGPVPDKCLPQASLYMSKEHPLRPLSEPMLIARYAAKHGMAAMKQGLEDMCKE